MVIRFAFRKPLGWRFAVVLLLATPASLVGAPNSEAPFETAAEGGAAPDGDKEPVVTPTETGADVPVYQPPRRGAPKTRVGGGTRDLSGGSLPTISLLAPMATGLTSRPSPTLFWHLSKAYEGVFEFVLIERNAGPEPVYRQRVERRFDAGYHAFDLAHAQVELVTGRVYQWSVALVRDPERRSQDVLGLATVERADPQETVESTRSVQLMASAGLWYDAIEAISPPPDSEPDRGHLAALLRQVGLAVDS